MKLIELRARDFGIQRRCPILDAILDKTWCYPLTPRAEGEHALESREMECREQEDQQNLEPPPNGDK